VTGMTPPLSLIWTWTEYVPLDSQLIAGAERDEGMLPWVAAA
jgi:hypothetical protein